MSENNNKKIIRKVSINTIIANALLSALKLIVGILAKSTSLISDAVHSLSDIFTTFIVMFGAKISTKESDNTHEYGHEKFEAITSFVLGVLLAITAIIIGYTGIKSLITGTFKNNKETNFLYFALFSAILSIVVKGLMFFYTTRHAKKIKSNSLKADAWHHLSDSLSSIGTVLGIIGLIVGKGMEILDPIAAIIIAIIILKVVYDILKSAVDQLVDKSISPDLAMEMEDFIRLQNGVIDIALFKSRQFGNKIYIDLEIYVDRTLSIVEANNIAETIHNNLEEKYKDIKHCTIWAKPKMQ